MPNIEKTELTEETQEETQEQPNEQLEALKAAEKRAQEAEIARARAEGEAAALKSVPQTQSNQPAPWTEAQWEEEGSKRGMTGQQFRATVELTSGIVGHQTKQFEERAMAAEKAAKEAREEIARLKARGGTDSAEREFYEKNPALKAHKSAVKEFLDSYPDKDTVDETTLNKRLKLAQDFVKGRVKETMRPDKKGNIGSSRLEGSDEESSSEDIGEFDPKGTGNPGAAYLMAQVHGQFGSDLRHQDSVDVWKKSLDEEGRGVSISSEEDVRRARAMAGQDIIGGKRG